LVYIDKTVASSLSVNFINQLEVIILNNITPEKQDKISQFFYYSYFSKYSPVTFPPKKQETLINIVYSCLIEKESLKSNKTLTDYALSLCPVILQFIPSKMTKNNDEYLTKTIPNNIFLFKTSSSHLIAVFIFTIIHIVAYSSFS
jgi:hypothetical protein